MSYGYSAKTNIFYVIEDKKGYEEFGNWPDDVKPISDELWKKFSVQGPPGKMRGANKNGMPCWVDIPPPTREQQIDAAERKKALQLEKASKEIAPLQDAVDLNVATEQEQKKLIEWKHYRVALSRIDTSEDADIVWPELPEQ
ncbi:tail fiber assembly protein [Serratia fonticola]|uniref:tail fiber assembly protein n=1 Tax=Serratia fonticola TaxID=47917 RepID=UPI000E0E38B5|nr:tail fiber assembly protein [Serratia fonticola]RDL25966.1 virus tail fiber assembly protein lambda gpK [Serratia fonticola]